MITAPGMKRIFDPTASRPKGLGRLSAESRNANTREPDYEDMHQMQKGKAAYTGSLSPTAVQRQARMVVALP